MDNFKYPYLPEHAAGGDLLRILVRNLNTDELGVLLRGVYWCCNGWPDDDEREWFFSAADDNPVIDLAFCLVRSARDCIELEEELLQLKAAATADKETIPKPVSHEGGE